MVLSIYWLLPSTLGSPIHIDKVKSTSNEMGGTYACSGDALLFIDKDVLDADVLLDHFRDLESKDNNLHFFSHGRPGELLIDGIWLDQYSIVELINDRFEPTEYSSLFFYGCNFAFGPKGSAAVAYIEKSLNLPISASTNLTGNNGDWDLEIGERQSDLLLESTNYNHSLQCLAGPTERTISGRVYRDDNLNMIDEGEAAVANVDVLIYEDVNKNGVLDPFDILLSTETTDANGDYSFTSTPVIRTYIDSLQGDIFSGTNNNDGNTNWANDFWVRSGNNANAANVSPFSGFDADFDFMTQTVQLQDGEAGMYRLVDLTFASDATLSFQYDWDNSLAPSLDRFEDFYIEIDPENDGTYIGIDTIDYSFFDLAIPVTNRTITIPSIYLGQPNTRIRFTTDNTGVTTDGEAWWIDNIELSVTEEISNYIVITDVSSYPGSFSLTTDNVEVVNLPTGGTCSDLNNFGLLSCISGCPPIVEDDAAAILQGESIQLFVLDNDTDSDGVIDPTSLSLISPPANGSISLDIATGSFIYTPVGAFIGLDQFEYEVCDNNSPNPLCNTAIVSISIVQRNLDVCEIVNLDQEYYVPFPAEFLFDALRNASSCPGSLGNQLKSIVSIKCPYPGAVIEYDHWEDGYGPVGTGSTERWGDGDLTNGVAPNYPNDLIPAGGDIILDNTFGYNPRTTTLAFDGKDRIATNSTIALSYIAGDANPNGAGLIFDVQSAKTDVYDVGRFGTSYTVPFGENLNGVFIYTSLFIRASEDVTTINIDLDANGINDTTAVINQGEVLFIDGGVQEGAVISSDKPIGVDVLFGGNDCFGTRQVNLYPAEFYSNTYYTPVPTTRLSNPVTIYFYNSLNRQLDVDWTSNSASGTLAIPANSSFSFELPLDLSAYKFESQTGESFTAISVVDNGSAYDWSFNLISAGQLTNFASIAYAPGSRDFSVNHNPVWVTPIGNTTIYVQYDGNLTDTSGILSPCRIPFDTSFVINELDFIRLYDDIDNDQSGMAIYTCDGTPIAAVYGEDPSVANPGSPSSDLGTTIQPLCIEPAIIANNDEDATTLNFPITTEVLENDRAFLTDLDSTSVSIVSNPSNGSVTVNPDGTITYLPDPGYFGTDQYQYFVCSFSEPNLCDFATVFLTITTCPADLTEILINGFVYNDQNQNGINDSETGLSGISVNIYNDIDQSNTLTPGDTLITTEITDPLGAYRELIESSNKIIASENFSSGDYNGGTGWSGGWVENADFGTTNPNGGEAQVFSNTLRIVDNDLSIFRDIDLSTVSSAALSFDYRRIDLDQGDNLDVLISTDNGTNFTPIFTVFGNNSEDLNFVNTGNIDLSAYTGGTVRLLFAPSGNWSGSEDNESIFLDNFIVSARTELPTHFIIEPVASTIPEELVATTPTSQLFFAPSGGLCSQFDFGYINLCAIGIDTDNDGLSDICDIDDDNDGILDTDEHSPCNTIDVLGYDALWNYEGTLDDESTSDFDATNNPGISYNSNAIAGNSSVEFDGTDFIQYSDGTFLNQPIASFSYSFWFNPASFTGIQFLLDEGGATNGVAIRLNGNFLEARIKDGADIFDAESFLLGRSNIWYHVVLTYDVDEFVFYLNNEAQPSVVAALDGGALDSHTNGSGFGGSNSSNAYGTSGLNGFTGLMDQFVHYPFALSPEQIESLYFICDTDQDGVPNRLDLDSDNDGILDVYEAGHGLPADSDGVILDADNLVGDNGLVDDIETSPDSDNIDYILSDSEPTPDNLYDPYELDSDADGCYDSQEATVIDTEPDGIAGTGAASVDANGLVDSAKPYVAPPDNSWQDPNVFGDYCQCRVAILNPHIMYFKG